MKRNIHTVVFVSLVHILSFCGYASGAETIPAMADRAEFEVLHYKGIFRYEQTDALIPGRYDLELTRTYRSENPGASPFGRGWSFAYNERLVELDSKNILHRRGDGEFKEYTNDGGGNYSAPSGVYNDLTVLPGGGYALIDSDKNKKIFNTDGCLATVLDRNGNQLLIDWDPRGKLPIVAVSQKSHSTNAITLSRDYRVVKIETAHEGTRTGRYLSLNYSSHGFVTNVTDYTGRSWTYSYDSGTNGTLTACTSPPPENGKPGQSTSYAYLNSRYLASVTVPGGTEVLQNEYDDSGRVQKLTRGGDQRVFFYPDSFTRTVTNSSGFKISRTYDGLGRMDSLKVYSAGIHDDEPTYYEKEFSYNSDGEIISVRYPKGNVEEFEYDENGKTIEERLKASDTYDSSADIVDSYTYESRFNQIKTAVDANGNTTVFVYDYELGTATNGNLVQIRHPVVGSTTAMVQYAYNEYGDIVSETDESGVQTLYEYSSEGYLLKEVFAVGTADAVTNTYTYDDRGNLLTQKNGLGTITSNTYDQLDRLVESRDTAGGMIEYTYNDQDLMQEKRRNTGDPGQPWLVEYYQYDSLGRATEQQVNGYTIAQYEYDINDRITAVTDANGRTNCFEYDERELMASHTDPAGGTTAYNYGPNGYLTGLITPTGYTNTFANNDYNQQASLIFPDGLSESYFWDQAGNATARVDRANRRITCNYDSRQRLVSKLYSDGSYVNREYDAGDNVIRSESPAGTNVMAYNSLNRLISVTNVSGWSVLFEYNALGARKSLVYPDGTILEYLYNTQGLVTNIVKDGLDDIVSYSYDLAGRRTSRILGNGITSLYLYDNLNNLTNLTHKKSDGTVLSRFVYSYDAAGNVLSADVSGLSVSGLHQYAYDSKNQLTSVDYPDMWPFYDTIWFYDPAGNMTARVSQVTNYYAVNSMNQYTQRATAGSPGSFQYAFDSAGNLISNGMNRFAYDVENNLISAGEGADAVTFNYDLSTKFPVSETSAGQVVQHVYDYANLENLLAEFTNGTLKTLYIYGPEVDEPLMMISAGTTRWYLPDGQGNTVQLADDDQNIKSEILYAAVGEFSISGETNNCHLYKGRRYIASAQSYDMRARAYHPELGRFMQMDPILFSGGLNLYRFAKNNFPNRSDPSGLTDYWRDDSHDNYKGRTGWGRSRAQGWRSRKKRWASNRNSQPRKRDYYKEWRLREEVQDALRRHIPAPSSLINNSYDITNECPTGPEAVSRSYYRSIHKPDPNANYDYLKPAVDRPYWEGLY